MKTVDRVIGEYLDRFYRPEEFPALGGQCAEWSSSRPLERLRILDATPLFRNTLAKHRALLAAGAELVVATADEIPFDPAAAAKLDEWGIRHVHNCGENEKFDLVLDCGGIHACLAPRLGFVELTRTGVPRFADSALPVISVDGSRLKQIETALGTGDGLVRAMRQLGYDDFQGKRAVVFGGGKVGRGIAVALRSAGALPAVVDDRARWVELDRVRWIDRADREQVRRETAAAWCAVSATGVAGALAEYDLGSVMSSPVLFANMGVEDEFGERIPAERVLGGKKPLNFLLDEPTRMPYIDPVMALSNLAALRLASGRVAPGISVPAAGDEDSILAAVRAAGVITAEVEAFL